MPHPHPFHPPQPTILPTHPSLYTMTPSPSTPDPPATTNATPRLLNMNFIKLFKVFLMSLVLVIGLVTLTFMDIENTLYQGPLEFFKTRFRTFDDSSEDLIRVPEVDMNGLTTTNDSLPHGINCKCRQVDRRASQYTKSQLDMPLNWLNLSIKDDLSRHHPNIPADLYYKASQNKACNLLPSIFSIEWWNVHWQETNLDSESKLLLYSAFYDPNIGGEPCVRVLGVSKSRDPRRLWCHIWYSHNDPPLVTKISDIVHLDYQSKNSNRQMPYLLTCPLPPDNLQLPVAVSLLGTPCTSATNLLKVIGAKERNLSAYVSGKAPKDPHSTRTGWVPAVCGPALYYYSNDFSWRLVEWLELLRAQGFGQVFLYDTGVHPNVSKVLHHYREEGFIEVTDYNYPPPYVNEPSIRRLWTLSERQRMFAQENVYFTDCLLRHMHQYRFIFHLDPDEMPLLINHTSFPEFLDSTLSSYKKWYPGYKLQWNMFYDDLEPRGESAMLPKYLWMLRHSRRPTVNLKPSSGKYKALYDMDTARGVFSHGTLMCTTGWCSHQSMAIIPFTKAYIGHFSKTCGKNCESESSTKEVLLLQRYRLQVSAAVKKVLLKLQLL
ncbi:hypothetical protein Pcinc_008064 [Petrolisthes cinctipes]|uniref:Glycosyltransferase family 92 protein n=1 Tax=Petrolisthes cinctipes TaxID=88211 RepID=A0AAE1GA18_PETCI|nr:hypothetical protein Pcinc_008064 [Petrolisthes cinctipes]